MNTHNIQFNDKKSLNICFLENFQATKRVRISHGKRDIGVRVIDGLLLLCILKGKLRKLYINKSVIGVLDTHDIFSAFLFRDNFCGFLL